MIAGGDRGEDRGPRIEVKNNPSYETPQVDISNWIRFAVLMTVLESKDELKNIEYRTAE